MTTFNYTKAPDGLGYLMPLEQFLKECEHGYFTDYDGYGYPVKNGLVDEDAYIRPSDRQMLARSDADAIQWYNR